MDRILVTGASGFVAKHLIGELLRAGYRVRGTVRNRTKLLGINAALDILAPGLSDRLEIVEADLLADTGWAIAMQDVQAVMHVAGVIAAHEPKDPAALIRPAVEGTERVLRFAAQEHVRRVIMTSSIATVGYGHDHHSGQRSYSDADFTDLTKLRHPWAYCTGQTRAEQAAWALASGKGLHLTTIHPGAVLGPATDAETSLSLRLLGELLNGSAPALPCVGFAISDIRDVAAMHLAALRNPDTIGQRYLCTGPYRSIEQVEAILRAAYPKETIRLKTVPDWAARLIARFGGPLRQLLNDIGNEKHFDGSKGERLLGRSYHTPEDSILAAAESLIRLGLIQSKKMRNHSAKAAS